MSMLKGLQSTPYTPIFPSPLPTSNTTLPSGSCDSSLNSSNETTRKSYIDRLKERHLLLSSLPEELCPPSRETSPEAQMRIDTLTLRMRKARELRLPLEFVLTSVGVKGGDWVGVPTSDEFQGERQFCLPATEEDWFEWEKKQTEARDTRRAEKKAAESRQKIERWSEAVEEEPFLDTEEVSELARADSAPPSAIISGDHEQQPCIESRSRYFQPGALEIGSEHSEPVQRTSSPLPPSPVLDPIPDFCDSFSLPDSPPILPHDTKQKQSIPDDIALAPSFAVEDTHISTPLKRDSISEPVHQLSSPISPPRCLRSLTASQTSIPPVSAKRCHENDQPLDTMSTALSTPRAIKRAKSVVEPITPKSVWRPKSSQEFQLSQDPNRLPTLDALLAARSEKTSSRRGTPSMKGRVQPMNQIGSPSPHCGPLSAGPDFSPSQPTYSMFRPQFHSTQNRAVSLPPSPSQPVTLTRQISSRRSCGGTGSSGIGLYQSQFNVESKIDQVTAFLDADVWNVEE